MKQLLVGMVLLVFVVLYLFEKDEEALVIESNSTRVMEENQTITSPPQVKNILDITEEIEKVEEQNTTVPKLCLKYKIEDDAGEKYELDQLGRVKSITRDANGDGEVEHKEFRSYDEFGNLLKIETEIYQEIEKLYRVDEKGREYYRYGEYESIPTKKIEVSNSYDSQNRLTEQLIEYPTHSKQFIYEYDEHSEPIFVQIFVDDTLVAKYKGMHEYDEKGRLIHRKNQGIEVSKEIIWLTRQNPENLNEKIYTYNDINQIIHVEDLEYHRIFKYDYDEQGNKIRERTYRDRKYDYDEQGNKIRERTYLERFSGKKYQDVLYKYDEYGNLLEKIDSNDGKILLKQEFGACEE